MGSLACQQEENKEKPFRVHYYRWSPSEFHSDPRIRRLTPMERGVYRDLLDMMWLSVDKYRIHDDPFTIPRMVNIKPSQWLKIRAKLQHESGPLFREENGYLVSDWLKEEFDDIQATLQKKSEAGKKSAEKRALDRMEQQGSLPLGDASHQDSVGQPAAKPKGKREFTRWQKSADGRQAIIAVGKHIIPQVNNSQSTEVSIPSYSTADHVEESVVDTLILPPQTENQSLVRLAIRNTLKGYDAAIAQQLLDTLAYQLRHKTVSNIPGYFSGIIRNYHEGNFSLEGAMIVAAERDLAKDRKTRVVNQDEQFMDEVQRFNNESALAGWSGAGQAHKKLAEILARKNSDVEMNATVINDQKNTSTA